MHTQPTNHQSIHTLQTLRLLRLSEHLLQRRKRMIDIIARRISDTDTHMTEADILRRDLLMQTSCEDDAALKQTRQDVRTGQTLGEPHGGHAVGLGSRVRRELLQTEVGDSGLDAVGGGAVDGEAVGEGFREDLREGGVEGVDELGGRGGEVRRFEVLVVLQSGNPVRHRGVVRRWRGLAGVDRVEGARGPHGDAQTRRAPDGFLGARQDDVQVHGVEGDILAGDAADAVDGDEGLRGDAADELGDGLGVVEHAGRGVGVGEGDELVGLRLEGLLNLGEGRRLADGDLDRGDIGAVGLQAGAVGVAEVARDQDEGVVALLDQVGRDHLPAERAAAADDEGLGGGVGGLEELPDHRQGLAHGLDEGRRRVALTWTVSTSCRAPRCDTTVGWTHA